MSQKWSETKLPDFYPSSVYGFKQIMSCKISKQGWVYIKRIHEKIINQNFEREQINNKKQEVTSNKLIRTLLNQQGLLYPNQFSIFFDLELSVSDKPFNKNIGYLQLKNNSSVFQEFQYAAFQQSIQKGSQNIQKDQKYQIYKIPNFGSLLRLSQNKQWNIIIKTYKWNELMFLNNFYFFTSLSIEQLFSASKNDEQKRKQLQNFKKISSLPFQCLIQFNGSNNIQNLNKQNKKITLKQKTKNRTNYFFQVKLVCEDLMGKTIIIGCTSKCYFYCQDQLLIQTKLNFQNNSQGEHKKKKRKFKCIQRSTIKDDCLKQGDVVIRFQKSQKLTQNNTFRETSWIIESITKKVKEKENKENVPTKYQYFQPSLQKGQAIKNKQSDSKKIHNLSQEQENVNKGAFFFNGFMLRVDYPLIIKIDKMFSKQQLQKYIKSDSDRQFVIKFNIFLTLGDLLAQLKYKYKFVDLDLNKKYKFTIDKQDQENINSHDQTFFKSSPIQLTTTDVLYQYYRKIHIVKGDSVNIQIQLIQNNQKAKNFNVILAENNLVRVKGKMLGVPVKELKQNDQCMIYDQKKDDIFLNTIVKIQKLKKKPKKIFRYNLTGPKNQTNFTASENITFSVGNDLYSQVIQETLVCDIFPRASYSQNRFKAIKQQVNIKQSEQFYKVYFQKSDFVIFQFPVRIQQQEQNKEIKLQINFIQTKKENEVKFEIVMYNTERMTQSFKHLIQSEFYRWKTIKNMDNELSRQFCLIINHKIYSMYSNFKYVLEKDASLKQENIEAFLTEVPKAYFHRLLYQWKQQQKQRIFKSKYEFQNMLQNQPSKIQKEVQLPKVSTIINAIQKFNDPVDINTINNEFLMNILWKINQQNSTNSKIQNKQQEQSYYNISSQLIKKQWFTKDNVFFFREIIQVKKNEGKKDESKKEDSFVLSFLTKQLLTLNKNTSKMDQTEQQKYYLPPYTYFFVQRISQNQNKVYLKEILCDVSFKKKVIIWVDYNFGNNKNQNHPLIKMIKQNPFLDLILMVNYSQAIRWIKIFGPVFNKLNIKILLISNLFKNMKNQKEEQNEEKIVQQKGGLYLIKQFKEIKEKYENIEKPILYCSELAKARKLREDFKLTDKDCTITNDSQTMKCQLSINVLVVCDKFRGSLSSKQVNSVIVNTLENQFNQKMKIQTVQIADGGQGSLAVIKNHVKEGKQVQIEVTGPILESLVKATYYIQNHTAYIQMAQASGLKKLERQQDRNPYRTTTKGVGQLIFHAIKINKAKKIYVFVGGSATNQGGIGMARALGYKFYDNKNQQLKPIGSQLKKIHTIRQPQESTMQKLKKIQFKVFTDVNNLFYGPNGATRVYAPQKGAKTESMLQDLDEGLKNLNNKLIQCGIGPKIDLQLIPGSGAAGGLAGGCIAFLGAKIQNGTDYIMKLTNIDQRIKNTDIIITGEGKLDQSTLSGKAVSGVIQKAQKFDKQCLVLCGICQFTKIQKQNFYKMHPKTKIIQLAQNEQDVKNSMKKEQAKKRIQNKIRKHFNRYFKNYLQLP